MESKKYGVLGMHCDHCKKAVTEALQEVAGIERVEVSLAEKQVTVWYDGSVTDEAVRDAVEAVGFEMA